MRALRRNLAIGSLALLIAGCSLLPGAVHAALDAEWVLQAGSNQGAPIPIVPGHRITLKIDGSQVGGSAACNSYGGKLAIDGTTLTLSELIQTEMACQGDGVMASEAAYLAALAGITTAARDGDALVLSGPQIELHFVLVPPVPNADLVGPTWLLDSLISGEVVSSVAGNPATLQLHADGSLSAATGCRDVTGQYRIAGNIVQVTIGPMDLFACAEPLGAQDAQVLAVIGAADGFTVTIEGESMTLTAGAQGLGYRVRAAGS